MAGPVIKKIGIIKSKTEKISTSSEIELSVNKDLNGEKTFNIVKPMLYS